MEKTEAELMTITAAAKHLGIGRSTCYAMARRGELPGVLRVSGMLRVSRTRMSTWIANNAASPEPRRV
jgi:excisionase family DNA binding protein